MSFEAQVEQISEDVSKAPTLLQVTIDYLIMSIEKRENKQ